MNRIISLIFLLITLSLTGKGDAQTAQYENQLIEKIEITLVNVPDEARSDTTTVRTRMKTKEGGFFSQTDFDSDLKQLARDFDRVEPSISTINDNIHITLKVWPKPIIRSICWSGNEKLKTKKLQSELGIASFSLFDRKEFNQAFHKLKAYYIRKGFFEAELDYTVTPDPHSNEVDIEIQISEGRSGRIRDIFFVNFTEGEMNDVLDQMITKRFNLFSSWMTGEGTYNEDAVRQDEFTILNYLQDKGYADAQVRIEVQESQRDNNIVLYIVAEKGEKYRIGKLTFEGNCLFEDETICKLLLVKEEGIYSPELIRESSKRIMDYYGRKGYIDTIVDYEPRLEFDDLTYSIHFTIEEGEQYRVGLIKVFGNCSTQTNVILHESLLIPGELFNAAKLKRTEERLYNIGYFNSVNVYAVKSDGVFGLGENYRDVHIEVEEMATGSMNASIGFSTVESLFGSIDIIEKNFNIKGFSTLFSKGFRSLRGGGEYVKWNTTIGIKSRSYNITWLKPYFLDTPWTIGFSLDKTITKYISKDYDIDSYGFKFNASYQINAFLNQGYHYRLTHSRICIDKGKSKDKNDPSDIGKSKDKKPSDELKKDNKQLKKAAKLHSLVSAIGVSFVYSAVNRPWLPTKGFKSTLEGEIAGIGSEVRFASFAYLNKYYYPLTARSYLQFRGDIRLLQPIGVANRKIPIDERFFLGGETVIRGYRDFAIGPQTDGGEPLGGLSMQLFSGEYVFNVNDKIDAFAFFDAGALSSKPWNVGQIYTSVGYGLRLYILGNAPLTLGMGYPLQKTGRSGDVKKFFLQVGGRF